MGKFVYKYESLMHVKEIQEKRIQEEISLIAKEIEEFALQLTYVKEERSNLQKQILERSLKVAEFQSAKMYDSHLEKKIFLIIKKIESLIKAREEKQIKLVEKKKEHKTLEILKENELGNHVQEEKRKEMIDMNEIAIRNYGGLEK